MMFFLCIFMLTALMSNTVAQYNYEKPLKDGGYIYSAPELPFNDAPPFKSFSAFQASTSAPKLVDKTPAQGYIYLKPNVSFTLPTQIQSSTTSKPPSIKEAPTSVSSKLLKPNGYSYPKPSSLGLNETVTKPPISLPKPSGYTYTRPLIPFIIPTIEELHSTTVPTPQSTKSYSYTTPKPSTDSTLASSISPISPTTGYTYTRPAVPFTIPPRVATQLPKLKGYSYPVPKVPLILSNIPPKSKDNLTTKKGIVLKTQPKVFTEVSTDRTVSKISPTPSTGYSYSAPAVPFTIPPKNTPTRPSNVQITQPPSYFSKPITLPETYTTVPLKQVNGYTYTRPAVPFTIPPRVAKDKPTQLPKLKGYSYPVPKMPLILSNIPPKSKDNLNTKQGIVLKNQTKVFTELSTDRTVSKISPTPSTGYSYSPPAVPFTIPLQNTPTIPSNVQITQPPSSFSKPITLPETNTAVPLKQVNGYVYSRPDIPFKTPKTTVITISSSSVIQPAAPTKSLPKSNGYSYTPPNVTFTIPSSTPAANHLPKKTLGYSYTPPKVTFQTPQKVNSNYLGSPEKGYLYPKPGIPFAF